MVSVATNPVVAPVGQRGGARPGAGRKPKSDGSAGDPYALLARAKAKHEIYRANLAELDFRIRSGELLERVDVETASARMHSFLSQSLRNLPDDLERRCGLSPESVQFVQDYIDGLTSEIKAKLYAF